MFMIILHIINIDKRVVILSIKKFQNYFNSNKMIYLLDLYKKINRFISNLP